MWNDANRLWSLVDEKRRRTESKEIRQQHAADFRLIDWWTARRRGDPVKRKAPSFRSAVQFGRIMMVLRDNLETDYYETDPRAKVTVKRTTEPSIVAAKSLAAQFGFTYADMWEFARASGWNMSRFPKPGTEMPATSGPVPVTRRGTIPIEKTVPTVLNGHGQPPIAYDPSVHVQTMRDDKREAARAAELDSLLAGYAEAARIRAERSQQV
jgi:hypothetical protein